MTDKARIRDDWIDAIFKTLLGFFAGTTLGYTAKLAALSNWWLALGFLAIIMAAFALVLALDRGIGRLLDWSIEVKYSGGIKPSNKPYTPHWFVRFGWLPVLLLGVLAFFVLPEGAFSWLI